MSAGARVSMTIVEPVAIREGSSLIIPSTPLTSKQMVRMRLYAGMVLLDAVAVVAGFAASNLIRFGDLAAVRGFDVAVLLWPIYFAIAASNGAYGVQALKDPRHGSRKSVLALVIAAAVLIGGFFYLKISDDFSRQVLAVGLVLSALAIAFARLSFASAVAGLTDGRLSNEVLLIDGEPIRPAAGEFVIIADSDHAAGSDPLALDRIGTFLRNVDRVILAAKEERRAAWVTALKGVGVDVEVLTPELDSMGPVELRRYNGGATLLVGSKPLGLAASMQKRVLDLTVSASALLILAPLLCVIALVIKLDSTGPIFFRQHRVGEGNRIFRIFKFRTMRRAQQDTHGDRSADRHDDRVTRVGKVLRRTSLDELPQLFNVLFGDMSVVGPRPHALASKAEEALFWEIDGRYWERHGIKPGITGLAQIRGFRGATETKADVLNRVQSDLEYLVGWSLWRDLSIILRTARVITHPKAF